MAHYALSSKSMHAVDSTDGCPVAPSKLYKQAWRVEGDTSQATPPCLLATVFSSPKANPQRDVDSSWHAWIVLNSCTEDIAFNFDTVQGHNRADQVASHDITIYKLID